MTYPAAVVDGGTRTGAAVLGVAVLSVVGPRADPAVPTLAGLGLLVVAVLAVLTAPAARRSIGLAAPAAAALLVIGVGQSSTATLVERDLRIGCLPLVLPLAAAALIPPRRLAAAAAMGGVLAGPLRMLFYDPFLDPACAGCAPGQLVVWPAPDLAGVLPVLGLVITMLAVLLALGTGRAAVELFGVLVCLSAYAADAAREQFVAVGGVLVACWLSRTSAVAWQRQREVRRLLRSLDAGDDLTTALRRDLGDRDLVVTFPDGEDFIDRSGTIVPARLDLATDDLFVQDTLVARVHHAPMTRVPDLATGLDDSARLALANEQLTAQLAARVHDLTRARAAVVETAVQDRRSLERDLHDGVQQDLLALGLDLRVAAAGLAPDDPDRRALDDAVVEVCAALDEVRRISHGVYPPLLATRGLAAAVACLARRTSSAVEVGPLPEGRLPGAVERAAFAVLAEAVDRGARYVEARLTDGRLVVRATGAGPGVDGILADLVAAVGGEANLGPGTISAAIACA